MSALDGQQRATRWLWRVIVLLAGPPFIYWTSRTLGVVALFPLVGWAILLVWLFDAPQLLFSLFDAARHKVSGVEGEGRHEWYGFRGSRLRIFLDEDGAPWLAVKELAHVLDIDDPKDSFRLYGPTEYAKPPFAGGEPCISDRGLRRYLKYSKHPDVHALELCWEREVLLPISRRRELYSGKLGSRAGGRHSNG